MDNYQRMAVYSNKEVTSRYLTKNNVYEVNRNKKHVWLQKLCLKLMKKLGCSKPEYAERVSYSSIEIKNDDFYNYVMRQIHEVRRNAYDVDFILIGHKQYKEFMVGDDFRRENPTYSKDLIIQGHEVRLVNWMEGVIVVPKKEKQNEQ